MIRLFKKSRLLIAALMLAAACGSAAPNNAVAGGNMGGYSGGSGRLAYVYVVNLYYAKDGRWNYYGRYFATKYSGGGIDWGGADHAASRLRNAGYQFTYTSSFWRITNNG